MFNGYIICTLNIVIIIFVFFYVLQAYRRARNLRNEDGSQLDCVITLLKHTSSIISFFSDKLFITHHQDPRLKQLLDFYTFFKGWKEEVGKNDKMFISQKLWFDMQSMALGFISLVRVKLSKFPSCVIKPAIVNQNGVENHFGQIRACCGQNNNPTYKLQQSCQNSIIFGQTTISKKSNVGNIGNLDSQTVSLPGRPSACS